MVYASETPFPVIMLKDLSPEGFFAPRNPPDHFDDSKKMIQTLARFHAASFCLVDKNEIDLTSYNYSIFESDTIAKEMFRDTFTALSQVMTTWEGFERYLPIIEYLGDNAQQLAKKAYIPNKPGNGYNVLNHADFHPRNSLVKIDNEKRLESFRLVS
jgi:hypothetical protein